LVVVRVLAMVKLKVMAPEFGLLAQMLKVFVESQTWRRLMKL
jgi:hypothetical protein